MENLTTWNVDNKHSNNEFKLYINNNGDLSNRYLLDLTKNKYTILEKFIYDTAMFHLNRLQIGDFDDYYIEFWCKSRVDNNKDNNNPYIECDPELKKTHNFYFPLLSCVTYFTDNNSIPSLISNIDLETYKYKQFEKQHSILLSLPRINKQIAFDGRFYHGNVALIEPDETTELYTMSMNIWDKKPRNMNYYIPKYESIALNREDVTTTFSIGNATCNVKVSEDIINYKFFNSLLYDKCNDACYKFGELVTKYIDDSQNSSFVFEVDKSIKQNAHVDKLKTAYGDIVDDFNAITNETIELKYNRFLQRFQFENVYSQDICKYIINECEVHANKNGGWTTKRHSKYPTTDLPVNQIPSIFGIILATLNNTIVGKIATSYNLNNLDISSNPIAIDINDLFIVKYSHDQQNSLKMHKDASFISFSVLLNSKNDFEGGGTYFDDGLTVHLNQGDILIHNSRVKHSGLPITSGTRYLLVGFINLHFA